MGLSKFSEKFFSFPSSPGLQKFMMLQNSISRFSTGVPLKAMFVFAEILRMALLWAVFLFLIFCASSMITDSQGIALIFTKSLRITEYVVRNPSFLKSLKSLESPCYMETESPDANFENSFIQF